MTVRFAEGSELEQVHYLPPAPPKTPRGLRAERLAKLRAEKRRKYEAMR